MKPAIDRQFFLLKHLRDLEFAKDYLNVALDSRELKWFLLALRNVVASQGGMKRLAGKTGLNRESLYKILSLKGNPGVYSLKKILGALGLEFMVHQKTVRKRLAKRNRSKTIRKAA